MQYDPPSALDPPLWTVVPNKALSLSLSLSLSLGGCNGEPEVTWTMTW